MRSEMTQAIADYVSSAMAEIGVALPGTVMAYDSATGRVNVKPFGSMQKPDGTTMEYPIITGVPICQPGGIAAPVQAGTSCLLVFCDIDISGWLSGKSGGAAPEKKREEFPPASGGRSGKGDALFWGFPAFLCVPRSGDLRMR